MNRLLGSERERLTLRAAVDLLGGALARSARPGAAWLAGLAYPTLTARTLIGWQLVQSLFFAALLGELRGGEHDWGALLPLGPPALELGLRVPVRSPVGAQLLPVLGLAIVLLPLMLPLFRLAVGLAGAAAVSDEPGARTRLGGLRLALVWRAGEPVMLSSLGLFVLTGAMLAGATLVVIGPVLSLAILLGGEAWPAWAQYALLTPVFVALTVYGLVVGVVHQLALHSLARHRLGAASALLHAWRLMRADPWTALRASLADLLLHGLVALSFLAVATLLALAALHPWWVALWMAPLRGLTGSARAVYWARCYERLVLVRPAPQVATGLPEELARQRAAGGW